MGREPPPEDVSQVGQSTPSGGTGEGPQAKLPADDRRLRKRLMRSVSWSAAGSIATQALGLPSSILVTRVLGKDGFGQLGIIQSTAGMFGQVAGMGLGLTGTKYVSEFCRSDPARAGRIVALTVESCVVTAGLASVACLALASLLASRLFDNPELAPLVRWAALLLFLNAVSGALRGIVIGFEAFRGLAILSTIEGVILSVIAPLMAWAFGVPGVVWAYIIDAAIQVIFLAWLTWRQCAQCSIPLRWWEAWDERALLWGFSVPTFLARSAGAPVDWIMKTLLFKQPGGEGSLGVFNAANRWRNGLELIPGWVCQSALPIMSEKFGCADYRAVRRVLRMSIVAVMAVTVPLAIAIAAMSNPLMEVNGPGFEGTWGILLVCLAIALLGSLLGPLARAVQASGRAWIRLAGTTSRNGPALIAFVLLRRHGAMGLAMAQLIGALATLIWHTWYVARITRPPAGERDVPTDVGLAAE